MDQDKAPWHAHIYYHAGQRGRATALRARLLSLKESGETPQLRFVGELRDQNVGPHRVAQFEVHFDGEPAPALQSMIRATGLRALLHPLTHDDLADHTNLGQWIGMPIELDLTVLDPPGVNQGIARFGKTDF